MHAAYTKNDRNIFKWDTNNLSAFTSKRECAHEQEQQQQD